VSAAAMAAATTVAATKAATGMTASAKAAAGSATESATSCWRSRSATCKTTSSAGVTACPASISATIACSVSTAPVSVAAAIAVAAPAVSKAPSVPRADTDEEAAVKPLRPVVSVGRAGVGVVRVVAPIADGRTVGIRGFSDRRANSDTHSHLGVCRCRERQSQKHCEQNEAKLFHDNLLVLPRPFRSGPGIQRSQHLPATGFFFPTSFNY